MKFYSKIKYGNTNTLYIQGSDGGLLVDTDYAGTMPAFYSAIKEQGIIISDIKYVLATHYHPDHVGLVSELMKQGVRLLLIDTQIPYVHFADDIFRKDRQIDYYPIDENDAVVITCQESRKFLDSIGIKGEIISTPSHSRDSISLILDDGSCFVGDLEPFSYIEAYDDNISLKNDWENILKHEPRVVYYGHANEQVLNNRY